MNPTRSGRSLSPTTSPDRPSGLSQTITEAQASSKKPIPQKGILAKNKIECANLSHNQIKSVKIDQNAATADLANSLQHMKLSGSSQQNTQTVGTEPTQQKIINSGSSQQTQDTNLGEDPLKNTTRNTTGNKPVAFQASGNQPAHEHTIFQSDGSSPSEGEVHGLEGQDQKHSGVNITLQPDQRPTESLSLSSPEVGQN